MLENNNNMKILHLFFDDPLGEFHIREISRITKVSPPTVISVIKKLEKQDIVKTFRKGNLKIVKATYSDTFIKEKRVDNLLRLYRSGLIEYISDLYDKPEAIVLFGSFSRGDDIKKSDIDIAVFTDLHKESNFGFFEKKLNKPISLHEINLRKISKEFYNNLVNGIVLDGAM